MISMGNVASVDYYLSESSSENLGADERKTLRKTKNNKGGYYEGGLKEGDPLRRPLTIHGAAASAFGLKEGETLSAEMFKNIYFGHHPVTGKPLSEDIPSKIEQDERQKEIRLIEKKRDLARVEYAEAFAEAMTKSNGNQTEAEADPKVAEARQTMEATDKELRSARNSDGHRSPGKDFAFSMPADINLIHAALLAEGRMKEARELEAFFKLAVDEACKDLEKYASASSGRSDRDGIRGESVKCVWIEATHFDSRPDENSVVSHNMHAHRILSSLGLTEDGRWVPVRTEDMNAQRRRVDGEMIAKLTRYCVTKFGVDPTAKTYEDGVLGVEFGGSRQLKSLAKKGFHSKLFGRRAQVVRNKDAGMSDGAASRKGRNDKIEGWSAEQHIAMQRDLLAESGLTLAAICGNRKEREREAFRAAEEMLKTKYEAEEPEWREFLAKQGFPNGKPEPFEGDDARDWIGLMKNVAESRKRPDCKIPPRPARPPGHPEYKERTWRETVGRTAKELMNPMRERMSLDPEDIVKHVSQIESGFSPEDLREEIARRLSIQPPKEGLVGAAQRLLEKTMTPEQLSRSVTKDIDRIYVRATKSDLIVESIVNGKKKFVAQDLRDKERKLYGEIFPELLKADPKNVRAMKLEDAKSFIKEWEEQQGFPFSPQQRLTLQAIATSQVKMQASLGWAGSGKSAQSLAAREILNRLGYRVLAIAPSHAAAGLLKKEMQAEKGYCPEGLIGALKQGKETIGPNDCIFLDEASMLALRSGYEVLETIRRSGARIIFSGDPKQLKSVGAGNVLDKFIELAKEAEKKDGIARVVHMNEVYTDAQTIQRQKLRIGKSVAAEAETGDMRNFWRSMFARGMVEVGKDQAELISMMSKEYRDLVKRDLMERPDGKSTATPELIREFAAAKKTGDKALIDRLRLELAESLDRTRKAYDNTILLAETNEAVDQLAKNARKTLKEFGVLGKEDVRINGARGKLDVAIGERLVLRGKIGTKDALGMTDDGGSASFEYNKSTLLTVVDIQYMKDGTPVLIAQLDEPNEKGVRTLAIPAERFGNLAYAYSRTVHLSQGMTCKNSLYMPSTNTRSELGLVGMTRASENGKTFVVASELDAVMIASSRQQRKLDALDYDEISKVDLDEAIERTVRRKSDDVDALASDAKKEALDAVSGVLRKPELTLSPVASAVRTAALKDKRTDVEKAAKLGVVEMSGRPPKAKKDDRSWLATYHESQKVYNPKTEQLETRSVEMAVAYDPKTGRIERWPADALDERRLTLARRSTMAEEVRKSIRDANEARDSDIKGVLVGTGIAPLKNSPGGKPTPWATIEAPNGEKTTIWGADVGRAIREGGFKVGDGIALNGDERVSAEVFGARPIPGGSAKYEGEIVSAPSEGKSGVVKLKDGREVRVFDAPEWQGLKAGEQVEVHSKIVDRRIWNARHEEPESSIPHESRLKAWAAAERMIADDRSFERLQAVGAGTKVIANDSEHDAKKRAIRTLKANGEGYSAVVDWNANVGATGRRAWHEAGLLTKGEDGVARASLSCVSLLDDGQRVYYAVAVQNQRSGDVEGMATRILSFEKSALGIAGNVDPGTAHEILVSDDNPTPILAGGWGGLPNIQKTTAQAQAERYEALLAKREAEDAAMVKAQNAILAAASKLPAKELAEIVARAERAEAAKPTPDEERMESLRSVGSIADLLPPKKAKPTETDADRLAREAIEKARKAAEDDAKIGGNEAATRPTTVETPKPVVEKPIPVATEKALATADEAEKARARAEERRVREERERARLEAERVKQEEALRQQERQRQLDEWARKTNEESARRRALDAAKAAEVAEAERVAKRTRDLERLDFESPTFMEDARKLIVSKADMFASKEAFGNAVLFANGFDDEDKRNSVLDYFLNRCPADRRDYADRLFEFGANPEIAVAKGYPIDLMLERNAGNSDVVAVYIEKGGDIRTALDLKADPSDILANLPGDSPEAQDLIAEMFVDQKGEFDRVGRDGLTFQERAAEIVANGSEDAYDNLSALVNAKAARASETNYGESSGGRSEDRRSRGLSR
jgi:hypothetical protein